MSDRSVSQRVHDLVEPPLTAAGLEVLDVEQSGAVLRVTVDRLPSPEAVAAEVDLDSVTQASRIVSAALDAADPLPGSYTLEVSSPGVERPLRTPEQFRRFLGRRVAVKTRPDGDVALERRIEGLLEDAGEDEIVVGGVTVPYRRIEQARTVFVWPEKSQQSKKATPRPRAEARR